MIGQQITSSWRTRTRFHQILVSVLCLQVTFEDVIAEPVSVRSGDRVWIWSHALFEVCRVWIYRIVTVLLALPLSVISGLLFAILSCFHIWSVFLAA